MNEQTNNHEIQLLGRITLRGTLTALTGLHIGGSQTGLSIGGVDLAVVRNSFTGEPYIPGSSIKGKMRALLERALNMPLQVSVRKKTRSQTVKVHYCTDAGGYGQCPLCNVFGIATGGRMPDTPRQNEIVNFPTRLIVRDARMNAETRRKLEENLNTDMPLTEVKTEVVIDRLTSMANPRQIERVPAGAKFDFEIVYNLYRDPEDFQWFKYLIAAMGLLEGDFLGGQGSRGYGQVKFENVTPTLEWFDGKDHTLEALEETKSIQPSEQLKTLWPKIAKERGLQP